ncbi:tRNA (guanosine(37)-N1)-methyltransferase TrmD [Candidatus Peregrinibacteria bacterium]|nr:tRNA (guanosine(37)-N1)-methyltransferase TrmD [Candidatus Peregrinibacteria bacterium]
MRIDVLTLFPAMFKGPLTESILARAIDRKLLNVKLHDLRKWGLGKYKQVDDSPYGGGAGMVMRADVLVKALEEVGGSPATKWRIRRRGHESDRGKPYRIYFSPSGKKLTQSRVERLARKDHLILLCGRYEGVDQRVIDGWMDDEISIGDYVLTGGELPAMVLIDVVARQIPGVLGKGESASEDSFSKSFKRKKEYPHYTRPEEFRGMRAPDVLLGGHHKKIEEWRKKQLR